MTSPPVLLTAPTVPVGAPGSAPSGAPKSGVGLGAESGAGSGVESGAESGAEPSTPFATALRLALPAALGDGETAKGQDPRTDAEAGDAGGAAGAAPDGTVAGAPPAVLPLALAAMLGIRLPGAGATAPTAGTTASSASPGVPAAGTAGAGALGAARVGAPGTTAGPPVDVRPSVQPDSPGTSRTPQALHSPVSAGRTGEPVLPAAATATTTATPAPPAAADVQADTPAPTASAQSPAGTGTPVQVAAPTPPTAPAAAATQTPGSASGLPTTTHAVAAQVVPSMTRLVNRGEGVHQVTLQLNPRALGDVRVVLTMRQGDVRVRLVANPAAHAALASGSGELVRALEKLGVRDHTISLAGRGDQAATVLSSTATAGSATSGDRLDHSGSDTGPNPDPRNQSTLHTSTGDAPTQNQHRNDHHSGTGDDQFATDGTSHRQRTVPPGDAVPTSSTGRATGAVDLRM